VKEKEQVKVKMKVKEKVKDAVEGSSTIAHVGVALPRCVEVARTVVIRRRHLHTTPELGSSSTVNSTVRPLRPW